MKQNAGMTLMELLVSILILSLLAVALGTGMDAAMEVYTAAQFETDSAALATMLDTALWDAVTFARNVRQSPEGLLFTNPEYGITEDGISAQDGLLCLGREGNWQPLINSGAYPELMVTDVNAGYLTSGVLTLSDGTKAEIGRGGVVYITYRIVSTADPARIRNGEVLIHISGK